MTNGSLLPLLAAPRLIWRFYHRFRRNVGRQTVHTKRMVTLMSLMTIALAGLTYWTFEEPDMLIAIWGGLAVGAVIGAIGFRLTTFEYTPQGRFYTPNAYLGIVISMLLVGRLAFRFFALYADSKFKSGHYFTFNPSPLTLVMLGLTFGYYIVYSSSVLLRFSNEARTFAPVEVTPDFPPPRG